MGRKFCVRELVVQKVFIRSDCTFNNLHSFHPRCTEPNPNLVQMILPGGFGVTWLTYEFIGKFYIWIFTYEFIGKLCSIIRSIWTHAAPVGAAGKIYMSYVFRKRFFVYFLLNFEANRTSSMMDFRISAKFTSNCELTEEILAILEFICNLPMKFICKLRSKIHM